jgi:hypothetical protein
VGKQVVSLRGSGAYEAADLVSDRVSVKVTGASEVHLWAEELLDVVVGSARYIMRVHRGWSSASSVRRESCGYREYLSEEKVGYGSLQHDRRHRAISCAAGVINNYLKTKRMSYRQGPGEEIHAEVDALNVLRCSRRS